jgi:hypothetical protein
VQLDEFVHWVAGLPTPTEAVYATAVLVTPTVPSRLPFFANALFRRAAARARSASAIFEKLVELNLVANASENLVGLRWMGVAETKESVAMRSKDRSVDVGNIVIERVRPCDSKGRRGLCETHSRLKLQRTMTSFIVFSTRRSPCGYVSLLLDGQHNAHEVVANGIHRKGMLSMVTVEARRPAISYRDVNLHLK